MIKAKIQIDYVPSSNTSTTKIETNNSIICNVDNSNTYLTNSVGGQGYKGFHLSENYDQPNSKLNGMYKCYDQDGYKGYCSGIMSLGNGIIGDSLYAYYEGDIPKYLNIVFDKVDNTYATSILLYDGTSGNSITVSNNNYNCLIDLSPLNITSENTHIYIRILRINKPYANNKITKLAWGYSNTYDDDILLSMKCSEQLMDTVFNINPCVLEQYANIVLKDKYGEFEQLSEMGLLNDNLTVKVHINNELINTYLTESWDINAHDTTVSLYCNDASKWLESIYTEKIPVKDRSIHDLLSLGFKWADTSFAYIDSDTEQYCKNIITKDSWVFVTSLKEYFEKVCLLGVLRIYWYKYGFVVARCY